MTIEKCLLSFLFCLSKREKCFFNPKEILRDSQGKKKSGVGLLLELIFRPSRAACSHERSLLAHIDISCDAVCSVNVFGLLLICTFWRFSFVFIHYRPHDSMLCAHTSCSQIVVKEIKSSFFVLCMHGIWMR